MMKLLRIIWIPALLLSACNIFSSEQAAPQSLLTPYVTQTPAGEIVPTETVAPEPTLEPTLTPTPFVHVLASNETISSLALTYGLAVNDILAINPEITPKALSVGTEILIPYINTAANDGKENNVSAISAPLALSLSEPVCSQTTEGGLWCLAQVSNPLAESATGITVTFTLKNSAGETISEQAVPALLNLLAPNGSLPVTAYFSGDIPVDYSVNASLKTALPVDAADPGYAPVEIKVNSIDAAGQSARVSAVIPVQAADSGISSIWVALIATDADGQIVGVRRLEYTPVTEGEDGQAIKVYVYSNSRAIQQVDVRAEAILDEG
jgi:LysM repeat protein